LAPGLLPPPGLRRPARRALARRPVHPALARRPARPGLRRGIALIVGGLAVAHDQRPVRSRPGLLSLTIAICMAPASSVVVVCRARARARGRPGSSYLPRRRRILSLPYLVMRIPPVTAAGANPHGGGRSGLDTARRVSFTRAELKSFTGATLPDLIAEGVR